MSGLLFFFAVWGAIWNLALLPVCPNLPANDHESLWDLQAATLQSHLPRSQQSLLPDDEETWEVLLWGIETQEERNSAHFKAKAWGVCPTDHDLCATMSNTTLAWRDFSHHLCLFYSGDLY